MSLHVRSLWLAPILCLSLILTGCGFQLRDQANLAPELSQLTLSLGPGSQDFNRDLRIALAQAGIKIVDAEPSETLRELKTNPLTAEDTILARASDNDVTQVERRLSLTYFIRDEEGKALWGPRTISTSLMLNNQDAEQSLKAAYNAEQMRRAGQQLADELVYDLRFASF